MPTRRRARPTGPPPARRRPCAKPPWDDRSVRSLEYDLAGRGDPRQARQDAFEAERVHLGAEAAAQVLGDDQLVPVLRRTSRSRLDADVGRNSAQHDAAYAAAAQLQIQLRAV